MQVRSYHGDDPVARIQFYWPNVSKERAEEVNREMEAIDWSAFDAWDVEFQRVKWLTEKLGKMTEATS